jgi:DNA-directed RNA polymerase II subunit RPB1
MIQFMSATTSASASDYYLKMTIDEAILESSGITMLDIFKKIITNKKILDKNILNTIHLHVDDDNANDDTSIDGPSIIVYLKSTNENDTNEHIIETLENIEIDYLNKVHIRGLAGINKIFVDDKKVITIKDGEYLESKYKCVETDGTNLIGSFALPNVEHRMTISNDISEIFTELGIEAARKAILNELRMVLSFDGSYINYRHLSLLADIMTYKGSLQSLTRHGINKSSENSALVRCSFEETVEILTESALYSQKDNIRGVSENIMLGQLAPCGTGIVDVLYDDSVHTFDEYVPSSPRRRPKV